MQPTDPLDIVLSQILIDYAKNDCNDQKLRYDLFNYARGLAYCNVDHLYVLSHINHKKTMVDILEITKNKRIDNLIETIDNTDQKRISLFNEIVHISMLEKIYAKILLSN